MEEEISVDLLKRSPRGVTLTAEGKLFLDLARDLLKRADESVDQVRARSVQKLKCIAKLEYLDTSGNIS